MGMEVLPAPVTLVDALSIMLPLPFSMSFNALRIVSRTSRAVLVIM